MGVATLAGGSAVIHGPLKKGKSRNAGTCDLHKMENDHPVASLSIDVPTLILGDHEKRPIVEDGKIHPYTPDPIIGHLA